MKPQSLDLNGYEIIFKPITISEELELMSWLQWPDEKEEFDKKTKLDFSFANNQL